MCFSATASFVAGATLITVGAITISKTRTRKEIPFATIPFFFGVQQIIEGVVWLSIQHNLEILNNLATYTFVFFAYIFWPIFVPFSVILLETDTKRKKILYIFQFVGIAVAMYLLYYIINNHVASGIVKKCITYTLPTQYYIPMLSAYITATSVSSLFSSHKAVNMLGILATLSFAVAYYFFTTSFVSVWCFFAAILSIGVYMHFTPRDK